MTSIKLHFRPSKKENSGDGRLFFRLIHKRRSGIIPTGYRLRASEWNSAERKIDLPEDDPRRRAGLKELQKKLDEISRSLELSVSEHILKGDYEVEDIVKSYARTTERDALQRYCHRLQERLGQNGQPRTARAYRSAVASLDKFAGECRIGPGGITAGVLKRYECWLLDRGLKMNTVSFYMRNLRVIYNKAVADGVIEKPDGQPFREVFTGVYATRHRALSEQQLNSLSALGNHLDGRKGKGESGCDYQAGQGNTSRGGNRLKLKRALDLFLFCFHARGMSYVDMAYLKKTDVGPDTITYRRKKTGRMLEVKITGPMRRIMESFAAATDGSPYVFPVIIPDRGNERRQYENGLNTQNMLLGELSRMAGLTEKVTTHVSRHTWASIAKKHKVPVAVISEALGHSSIKTTEIYLDSFGRPVLDKVSDTVSAVIKTPRKAA